MNNDNKTKLYLKLPTFNRKEENWTSYNGSITGIAYLGGAGLGSILQWCMETGFNLTAMCGLRTQMAMHKRL
jgi:hypothetical protein